MEIKNALVQLDPYRAKLKADENAQTTRAGRTAAPKDAAKPSSQGDRISLSPEAKLRTEAYSAAMSAPEVRQAWVDAIKARVDSGEYQPDSKKIAAKLLQEEPGLFRA